MKTKGELEELKKEYDKFKDKLKELTNDELKEVFGGFSIAIKDGNNYQSDPNEFSDLGKFDVQKKPSISEDDLSNAIRR